MLPGANRVGIADEYRFATNERPDAIGNNSVLGVIASTNNIAGADGCDRTQSRVRQEEGTTPSLRDQFGRRLAHRVNVMPSQGIIFPISKFPFSVFVALVTSDDSEDAG